MLASFVAGGVLMPGVHRLYHSYIEVQSELDVQCDHAQHDVAFEGDHVELLPDHCTLCTAATSYHLEETDTQTGTLEVDFLRGTSHTQSELVSDLPRAIRGPPSTFLI